MKGIVLFSLFLLTSCAGFVDSMHRQIDRDEGYAGEIPAKKGPAPKDGIETFRASHNRKNRANDKRPINNPQTFSLSDGGSGSEVRPSVKRDYRPQRYQKDDFVDNEGGGSLWAGQGSSSSLFTNNNDKRAGDVVIINVLDNLRNQISSELKRAFPDLPKKRDANGAEPAAPAPGSPAAAAALAAAPADDVDMKVYDKVSGTVIEEINKDYILIRGRKEVIFKKEKRSIEVQALVSRRDILENDYVNSDKILESRVFILR